MSYSLSFSEEFYTDETFPYDTKKSKRPTNVYQAIISMPVSEVRQMAKDVFGIKEDRFGYWYHSESFGSDVLDKIRETDTCSNLDSPVRVWIDPEGNYSVLVYDKQKPIVRKPRRPRYPKVFKKPPQVQLYKVENLDGMWPDELDELSSNPAFERNTRRYALKKAQAMRAREAGNLAMAIPLEKELEFIYETIPVNLRW